MRIRGSKLRGASKVATLSNAVSAFFVVASVSTLLSLLAVTLSPVGSATERSSEWTVFRCGHFLCVKEGPSRYAS